MLQDHNTIIIAVFSAMLSFFLDFCFRENKIFARWLDFWAQWYLKRKGIEAKGIDREDKLELASEWWWFKPLGYCVVCMNVWITFACLFVSGYFLILSVVEMLFVVLLSNFIVRYFQEKIL